jgi:hypothetical protein
LLGIAAGWFCCVAGIALYSYIQLDRYAPAQVTKWKLIEYSPSKVAISASYTFSVEGNPWEGQIVFSKPYYLNRLSAQKALEEKSLESWGSWYSHHNPQKSSLEKTLPYKKCFNALIVLGLLGYFWILKTRNLRALIS